MFYIKILNATLFRIVFYYSLSLVIQYLTDSDTMQTVTLVLVLGLYIFIDQFYKQLAILLTDEVIDKLKKD
jgi:hypothetical protein